jgi:fructose-1-phosphate kinase PfkB-like protein
MKKIAILGANPAWQKTLIFSGFSYGKVNRAESLEEFASGKGINCARACRCYKKSEPFILQFAGMENGRRLVGFLNRESFNHTTIETATPTRCCTTLLDNTNGATTECIEPSFAVTSLEADKLLQGAEKLLSICDAAAICGTLPGNTPTDLYTKFALIAKKYNVPILLDACKGVSGVLDCGCTIDLKINREELFLLTGCRDILEAMTLLFDKHSHIRYAAVTDGKDNAFASDGKRFVCYTLPELPSIVSTLGCGDTATAVLCTELAGGTPFDKAFQYALGAASANCLSPLCGHFDTKQAEQISEQIKVNYF